MEARVIDLDGVYDPCRPNDRLLLGGASADHPIADVRGSTIEGQGRRAEDLEPDRLRLGPVRRPGRGGRALLAGLISCARCGRRLSVLYTGRYPRPIYRCEQPNVQLGQRRCVSVAGKRIDETIAAEMLRAVAPMAIEAAEEA